MGYAVLLVLTTSWRRANRQINPVGQYKFNPSNTLNKIAFQTLTQDSFLPYKLKDLYKKCVISNSAKMEVAKFCA